MIDNDVGPLSNLPCLSTVELLYNVGNANNVPGQGTEVFLASKGSSLTSLAIIAPALSVANVKCIAANCPNLQGLWLRSNAFNGTMKRECLDHGYLSKLESLYFRVGENHTHTANVGPNVLRYGLYLVRSMYNNRYVHNL